MSEQQNGGPDAVVRTQTFDAEGPLELDVDIAAGRIDIHLGDDGETVVEIRQDSAAQPPWAEGAANILSWVGDVFGSQFGPDLAGSPADTVQQTRVEKLGNRLVVRAPKALPAHGTAVAVTVHAPTGSHLNVRTRLAGVTVTGAAGRVDVSAGSGDVAVEQTDGAATVRTGSGSIRLGQVASGLQLRSGSGDVDVSAVSGSATLATGTGDVWLGTVTGAVMVRTSSGDLAVGEAASGSLEAITGSGDIRVGIGAGVAAEIDLSSGAGRAWSELDVADTPPDQEVAVKIRARSGSGNATVTEAG